MVHRPYSKHRTEQLQALVASSHGDLKLLKVIQYELSFRDRRKAQMLKSEVDKLVHHLSPRNYIPRARPEQIPRPPPTKSPDPPQTAHNSVTVECPEYKTPNFVESSLMNLQNERLVALIEFAKQTALLKKTSLQNLSQHKDFTRLEEKIKGLPGLHSTFKSLSTMRSGFALSDFTKADHQSLKASSFMHGLSYRKHQPKNPLSKHMSFTNL